MQYHAKVHQRIVFKEVGKPLYEATTIQAVYEAIYHIAEGQHKHVFLHSNVLSFILFIKTETHSPPNHVQD